MYTQNRLLAAGLPHLSARGRRWVLTAIVLAAGSGCADQQAMVEPPAASLSRVASTTIDSAGVDSLARAIALALSDSSTRLQLLDAMRQSPSEGRRLALGAYLNGPRGRGVAVAAANRSRMPLSRLLELAAANGNLQISVPRSVDRVNWKGTSDVVVFGTSKSIAERAMIRAPESGYTVSGEQIAVPVWGHAPYPYVAIVPVERPFETETAMVSTASAGTPMSGPTISTPEQEVESMMTDDPSCNPEVAIVPCDTESTGQVGLVLPGSYSYNDCFKTTGFPASVDQDRDNVLDACEYQLAQAFRPHMAFASNDENTDRETYWAVRQVSGPVQALRIFYAIGYREDGGTPGSNWYAHKGDSEFIIIEVNTNTPSGTSWEVKRATLSAHWQQPTDATATYGASWLEYPGRRYGRPLVWVAQNKHANYRSKSVCDDGAYRQDDCDQGANRGETLEVLASANLGQSGGLRGQQLINCTSSRAGFPGQECFWNSSTRFYGWQTRTGADSGPYAESLIFFGF